MQSSESSNKEETTVSGETSATVQTETTTPQETTTETPFPTTAETPKEAVRLYLTAVFAGEVQAVNSFAHPEGDLNRYTQEAAERNEALNLTIQSLATSEQQEDTATVTAVVSLENQEAGEEITRSQDYVLRTDDGSWKIYESDEDEAA
jgi:ketosteroid isomerase-like protein